MSHLPAPLGHLAQRRPAPSQRITGWPRQELKTRSGSDSSCRSQDTPFQWRGTKDECWSTLQNRSGQTYRAGFDSGSRYMSRSLVISSYSGGQPLPGQLLPRLQNRTLLHAGPRRPRARGNPARPRARLQSIRGPERRGRTAGSRLILRPPRRSPEVQGLGWQRWPPPEGDGESLWENRRWTTDTKIPDDQGVEPAVEGQAVPCV